jgi:hypothetical protein
VTQPELIQVLTEISALLERTGHPDRAAWLNSRQGVLLDPVATDDGREFARSEVHSIVSGMGGLLDMRLVPDATLKLSPREARERLDHLADRLYELTR